MKYSLAIIFTCHNRKKKTCDCIRSIQLQENIPDFDLYICDDGSTDGTVKSIRDIYPRATILQGNGDLFWSKGMYIAMKAAVEKDYDFYLMINDDVIFLPTMWKNMYQAYLDNPKSGIVGCTLSKSTRKQSYGGSKFVKRKKGDYIGPMLAPDKQEYVRCDLANWNCILLYNGIIKSVGIIDNIYEHAMGDFDYSFRMKKAGYTIVLAKEYVGYCENNGIGNTFKDKRISRIKRIKKLFAANGLPIKSWYHFTMTYYVNGKIKNFILPYIKYLYFIILGKDCK